MKYVAFLRGINVGGHAIIKMDELKKLFLSLGFDNVMTYIQSGNVIFETKGKSSLNTLRATIENTLKSTFKTAIVVIVQSFPDLVEVVEACLFQKMKKDDPEIKLFVTFLAENPKKKLETPLFSKKRDVEIVSVSNLVVFCKSHQINGKSGFPNVFVEKESDVAATTRNWNVVQKIVER